MSRLADLLPDLGRRTLVMGILNATPDSFSDGGRWSEIDTALAHAHDMIAEGADLIDVGGESTRPGHTPVDRPEEIARVVPVIARLAAETSVPISIDTFKAATAEAALAAGATIVNDVWGLTRDPDLARVAAAHRAPVIVMHNRDEADGGLDVVADQLAFFARAIDTATAAGIPETDVVIDPGIGFGKTPEQDLAALARLDELKVLGRPILLGTSRKRIVGRILEVPPTERLFGTLATNVVGAWLGADILRVHDVRPHVEAARVTDAVLRSRK
ncbi:MAG: dihydropteroate synthase [Phyllobacteriaceae bacterium]|nr:dihydropteroate synthase [Phyllobacteriaceae bacterium]